MAEVILLGILFSFLFYELTDLTPGGIVVPGLLALYVTHPSRIAYTLVVAVLTYLVMTLLGRYLLLFGKRRFAVTVLVSFVVHALLNLLFRAAFPSMAGTAFTLVSFTVAGIMAANMQKQGPLRTVAGAGLVTALTEAAVLLLSYCGVVL